VLTIQVEKWLNLAGSKKFGRSGLSLLANGESTTEGAQVLPLLHIGTQIFSTSRLLLGLHVFAYAHSPIYRSHSAGL